MTTGGLSKNTGARDPNKMPKKLFPFFFVKISYPRRRQPKKSNYIYKINQKW